MVEPEIVEKLEALPDSLRAEVLHYIEFLLEKYAKTSPRVEIPRKKRKGRIVER